MTPKAETSPAETGKWTTESKDPPHGKGNRPQNERAATEWEKIFANCASDPRVASKMYEELIESKSRKDPR